jgi:hypothetical protein
MANQMCQNGACVPLGTADGGAPPPPNCQAPLKACVMPTGGGYCSDFTNDTNNCGACFKQCPAGNFCQNATCVPQAGGDGGTALNCIAPMTACDNAYCTDFKVDRANCGGCHIMCSAVQVCAQGLCM